MNDYMDTYNIAKNEELIGSLRDEFDTLLNKTFINLAKAKKSHLSVEKMYVPNMNFTEVNGVIDKLIDELENPTLEEASELMQIYTSSVSFVQEKVTNIDELTTCLKELALGVYRDTIDYIDDKIVLLNKYPNLEDESLVLSIIDKYNTSKTTKNYYIITYENGELTVAATRGHGTKGKDIMRHVQNVRFPKKIDYKDKIIIRGELWKLKLRLRVIPTAAKQLFSMC